MFIRVFPWRHPFIRVFPWRHPFIRVFPWRHALTPRHLSLMHAYNN